MCVMNQVSPSQLSRLCFQNYVSFCLFYQKPLIFARYRIPSTASWYCSNFSSFQTFYYSVYSLSLGYSSFAWPNCSRSAVFAYSRCSCRANRCLVYSTLRRLVCLLWTFSSSLRRFKRAFMFIASTTIVAGCYWFSLHLSFKFSIIIDLQLVKLTITKATFTTSPHPQSYSCISSFSSYFYP